MTEIRINMQKPKECKATGESYKVCLVSTKIYGGRDGQEWRGNGREKIVCDSPAEQQQRWRQHFFEILNIYNVEELEKVK